LFFNKQISYNTLKAIHKYVFSEIYLWAGKSRTKNLCKDIIVQVPSQNNKKIAIRQLYAPYNFLDYNIEDVFKNLHKDNYLKKLDKYEFVELLTHYAGELFYMHPFYEGNKRSQRILFTILSKQAGWNLDLINNISGKKLVDAYVFATEFDTPEKINPNYMKKLFLKQIRPSQQIKDSADFFNKDNIKTKKQFVKQLNRYLWVFNNRTIKSYFKSYSSMEEAEQHLLNTLNDKNAIKDVQQRLYNILTENEIKEVKERGYYFLLNYEKYLNKENKNIKNKGI